MKRYDSYKDSGIDWIGEIPSHWKFSRIKHIIIPTKDGIKIGPFGSSLTGKVLLEGPYKVYGQWNIIGKDFNAGKGTVTDKTFFDLINYEVKPNDILISMMGSIGKCSIVPENIQKGIMDSHLVKIRLNKELFDSKYFEYVYDKDNSNVIYSELNLKKKGSIMDGLNSSIIKDLTVPVPPISEQKEIADYLDWKCGEIDAAVAKVNRELELLDELKQSEISKAVTKGLHPDVSFKPSGIDWIGQIPTHWNLFKISRVYSGIGSGTTPTSGDKRYYEDNGYNWLQTGDLNDGRILSTSKHITNKALDDFSSLRFYPKGSIVIAMYGATIGKLGILDIETTTNQACCVLPINNKNENLYFMYSLFAGRKSLIDSAYGGRQPNISQETIKSFKIPVPPLSEQKEIADYLDKKCSEIDSLKEKLKQKKEKLQELRQSLISEVVTGKRKVK